MILTSLCPFCKVLLEEEGEALLLSFVYNIQAGTHSVSAFRDAQNCTPLVCTPAQAYMIPWTGKSPRTGECPCSGRGRQLKESCIHQQTGRTEFWGSLRKMNLFYELEVAIHAYWKLGTKIFHLELRKHTSLKSKMCLGLRPSSYCTCENVEPH